MEILLWMQKDVPTLSALCSISTLNTLIVATIHPIEGKHHRFTRQQLFASVKGNVVMMESPLGKLLIYET